METNNAPIGNDFTENGVEENVVNAANPPGTIIAYAGNGMPAGRWLLCDGAIYKGVGDKTALYNAIGTSWGRGDGSADSFNVPDLRGLFLRGWAPNGENDPDVISRTPQQAGGQDKNQVGSLQQDAFQGHRHNHQWSEGHNPAYGGPNNADGGDERNGFYFTYLTILNPSNDGVHGEPRTSYETRPKNVYVKYLIKY